MKRLPANDRLRDALAAEYVIGTLQGRARTRFTRHLRDDAELRLRVTAWEERLSPLIHALPERTPPARVWQHIAERIGAGKRKTESGGFWNNLAFWRGFGLAAGAFATALLAVMLVRPLAPEAPAPVAKVTPSEVLPAYVAVLSDPKTQRPVLLVSVARDSNQLMVKMLAEQKLAEDRALELWALPPQSNPRSLGLVNAAGSTMIKLTASADTTLGAVPALAVSLEPRGGSPTGLPTGPVLYSGPFVKTY